MFALNEEDYAKIARIAEEGDLQEEEGNWDGKIAKYLQAWELIPEPRYEWDGGLRGGRGGLRDLGEGFR